MAKLLDEYFKNRKKHILDQVAPRTSAIGNGVKEVYVDESGFLHRCEEPAVIFSNGTKIYYWHGWLHRLDGAAKIEAGKEYYYIEGKYIEDLAEFKRLSRLYKFKEMGFDPNE